ncbi:hypothetical protein BZA77DRAFT_311165 [Pyronema omphalodes]|nr:hypothetical protein BZA77DRAFT_311165 [Pyronema omphalodes]
MKLLLSFLLVTLIGVATAQPQLWRFKIRPTTMRMAAGPAFSGYLDITKEGYAGINHTGPDYKGFVSYMNIGPSQAPGDLPKNVKLYKEDTKELAYLQPTGIPHLWDLKFGKNIPKIAGVMWDKFAISTISCGGNCGGLGVYYDLDRMNRQWLAFRDPKCPNSWRMRYWTGDNNTPWPKEHYPIWMWREAQQ